MNKKRLIWQVPFLTLLIVGTVLIIRQQNSVPYQQCQGLMFGTTYNITYQYDRDLEPELVAQMQLVDSALSMFNQESVISCINQGDSIIPNTQTGRMFLDVIRLALEVSEKTGGAFDITVGPLVNAWGFGFEQNAMPSQQQVDSLLEMVGYKHILLRKGNRSGNRNIQTLSTLNAHPSTPNAHLTLDCSAIAKGYGVDQVAQLLKAKGIENYMVEIGGEVVTHGVNSKRMPWRIGVTKPTEDTLQLSNELQTVLNVTDRAMATSGNYRNFYYKGGLRYAHTIDPRTGYPVQHTLLSATVFADNCATADAYATAFMVMGMDEARRILDQDKGLMAYFIFSDTDGQLNVWYSPALEKTITD